MTRSCCAVNCANKSKDGWKMFNIPRGSHPFAKNRRVLWLQVIKRADWGSSGPNSDWSLCSAHFISGAPSMEYDSPDFVPSIFPHNTRDNTAKVARWRDENKGPLTRLDENIAPVPSPTGQMETDPHVSPEDQCVESRLQVKMNSPDSWDISIKQEEPEDHKLLNILHMVVWRSPSLHQEEPEPPHIKEEQEELLQRTEEPDGSMLTLLAVKSEVDDEDNPSHCAEVEVELESDTEVTEDGDDWEETSGGVHTGGKPFQCKLCSKSFSRLYHLKTHQRVHNGEKPFHCELCDKSFIYSSGLKRHQRIHTGEKPFQCKYCDKSFSEFAVLKTHQRVHTGEKPFHCKHCDKSFSRSRRLKTHQRISYAGVYLMKLKSDRV